MWMNAKTKKNKNLLSKNLLSSNIFFLLNIMKIQIEAAMMTNAAVVITIDVTIRVTLLSLLAGTAVMKEFGHIYKL